MPLIIYAKQQMSTSLKLSDDNYDMMTSMLSFNLRKNVYFFGFERDSTSLFTITLIVIKINYVQQSSQAIITPLDCSGKHEPNLCREIKMVPSTEVCSGDIWSQPRPYLCGLPQEGVI